MGKKNMGKKNPSLEVFLDCLMGSVVLKLKWNES